MTPWPLVLRIVLAVAVLGAAIGALVVISDGSATRSADAPAPAPAPRPAPSTPPSPVPLGIGDVTGALFDSARGDFGAHFDNSGDDGLVEYGGRPSVVANPQVPARRAFRMGLGPRGKRSEVLPLGPGTQPVDGESQFVRLSALLSPDFPTTTTEFQLILQWHHQSDDGSPPLALQVADGQLEMVSGGDDVRPIGPVAPGARIDLTMQIRFSRSPGTASVTVWRDGAPTGVTNWHPRRGTMFTPGAYLKMGMYRSRNIEAGGSVTYTDLKIGRTQPSIGGLGPLAAR